MGIERDCPTPTGLIARSFQMIFGLLDRLAERLKRAWTLIILTVACM